MGGYALGGRFTTLEGLLENAMEQVENNPLLGATSATGDSAVQIRKEKIQQFKKNLQDLMKCNKKFTLILDDPAGNSYIQVRIPSLIGKKSELQKENSEYVCI